MKTRNLLLAATAALMLTGILVLRDSKTPAMTSADPHLVNRHLADIDSQSTGLLKFSDTLGGLTRKGDYRADPIHVAFSTIEP
jgi:hypothetical protein